MVPVHPQAAKGEDDMQLQRMTPLLVAVCLVVPAGPVRAARDMCDILKDKGILTDDIELNECRAAQEKKEEQTTKSLQDFVKNWISYKEGSGFIINSAQTAPGDYRNPAPKPRFSFALGNRIQTRYTFTSPDEPKSADEDSSFRIRRFKTFFNGNAFYPWLKYKAQMNWVGKSDASGNSTELEDAIVDLAYFPALSLQGGQYKVPFDRQELTSSGAQQFVDRAITNGRFSFARDQGVMLHGVLGDEKLEWFEYSLGVFNGNGRNRSNNDNPDHLGVVRLYFMPFGSRSGYFKYSESDVENTPRPALALGAAGAYNPVTNRSSATVPITVPDPNNPGGTLDTGRMLQTNTEQDADIYRVTLDAHFKWRGLSLLGDYFFESRDNKSTQVTMTEIGTNGRPGPTVPGASRTADVDLTHGFLVQAGYFVIPKKVEIAGRYAMFNPEEPSNKQEEARGAINWFIFAHNLKLQTDFGAVTKQAKAANDTSDFEARAQMQIIF
jgi:phosphate-selective porin OprO/OprP